MNSLLAVIVDHDDESRMLHYLLTLFSLLLLYSTKYGIYEPNCGLDKVIMSWGHDGT